MLCMQRSLALGERQRELTASALLSGRCSLLCRPTVAAQSIARCSGEREGRAAKNKPIALKIACRPQQLALLPQLCSDPPPCARSPPPLRAAGSVVRSSPQASHACSCSVRLRVSSSDCGAHCTVVRAGRVGSLLPRGIACCLFLGGQGRPWGAERVFASSRRRGAQPDFVAEHRWL